jgi:hypothetical protein
MIANYPDAVEQVMQLTFESLNERQQRIYAANEAMKLGHGGIRYIADLLGCHRRTIERGLNELDQRLTPLPPQRTRKKGVADRVS